MAWTSCYRIQQIILLLTCIPLIRAEFLVNAKTQLGNVVRQSITEDISDNSIRLEFVDWDLTKITQVVDFKSGFSIFRAVLYGEVDLGQPTSQILCFVNNLGPKDFIEADSVSKLRQKNQEAIRTSENQLEDILTSIDLVIDINKSQLISPHIKSMCGGTNGAIYTSENDIRKSSSESARDYDTMMGACKKLTTRQLSRCNVTAASSCSCHYKLTIDWYPCDLRYCKGSNGQSYKCGIKTCAQTRAYDFPVRSKGSCWWDS